MCDGRKFLSQQMREEDARRGTTSCFACQKLLVLCSEFLLEVLEDEVLLVKWMECDKRGFLLVDTDHAVCDWNSDRTK